MYPAERHSCDVGNALLPGSIARKLGNPGKTMLQDGLYIEARNRARRCTGVALSVATGLLGTCLPDVPGNMVYKESSFTTAGDAIVVEDSPAGRLGLTVCYDLRFPELYQMLRFEHNAQVLLVPSAFTKVTGEAHWEILLRARAIETQCFVIAAAQAGKHNEKRESYGGSLIIDPWGTVIARLPEPSNLLPSSHNSLADRLSTGIAIADLNLSQIDAIRTRMPIATHGKFSISWKSSSP
ncbi:Nitrilase 2 [Dendrobium catenatum]|uniref:Nitrilase 2 n=1 Tax=Dendrobium catenatum TaxID=906689 RepID=A0A2I0WL62_9ASPA|nr:Nitrilase 2 [Dendrobium catenatum]